MKNFEQEFEELVKINKRINEIEQSKKKLELDLNNKCHDFVEKHNKVNVKNIGGNIESMLKNGVDTLQLVELLKSEEKVEHIFSHDIMKTLKNHMYGIKLENKLLNYNTEIVRYLEEKFSKLESVEQDISINDLFIYNDPSWYLINDQLTYYLKNVHSAKRKNRFFNESDFVYMVMFNTIPKDGSRILIYNYRAYSKHFISLLYAYIVLEQRSVYCGLKKGYIASDYLFIMDYELINQFPFLSKFEKNFSAESYPKLLSNL